MTPKILFFDIETILDESKNREEIFAKRDSMREELQKQFGIKIDKRHIQVQSPIRAVGLIDVPVKIYQDVTSVINLRVKEA